MSVKLKRIILIILIILVAFILGRLAFRGTLNMLLGGNLFGGDFL